ncbi:hypothetical protein Tco_0838658 [Tanacetum coccineum]|uniref:Uncharacterized protein n=1 Tax=Tanacetum coccineum TaxID=301880 RepID=A0ABQ5APG5_9ASTR
MGRDQAVEPVDLVGHAEPFNDDARPHPAKKTKSDTTTSIEGSNSINLFRDVNMLCKPSFVSNGEPRNRLIMEYLMKIRQKAHILEHKQRHLKITVLTSYTPYPSRKIRRICACTSQETTKIQRPIRPYPFSRMIPYSDQLNTAYRSSDTVTEAGFSYLICVLDFLYYFSSEQILLIFLPLLHIILISCEKIKEVMADIQTKTTMKEFTTNDKANYYSVIKSIMVNGKRAYELKGKFLDDLHDNAFSGTSEEDAMEHIEYFLKISNDYEGVANEEFFDVEEANNDDQQEMDMELFIHDIEITKTYEDYENELNDELEELWSKDGVPYEICDHICEPFRFKNGKAKWPTCNSNKDGFCNKGELPRMVRVGYATYFQDYEWYSELGDGSLKEEALKQKAIYEKSWGDTSQSVINFCAWLKRSFRNFHELDYELLVKLQDYWWKVNDHECSLFSDWRNHIQGPYANYYKKFLDKEEHEDKDKHGLFDNQKRTVYNIRRFEMIKYSLGENEEYVSIKEHEYDDLTSTNEDVCRTYQEMFHRMDEG